MISIKSFIKKYKSKFVFVIFLMIIISLTNMLLPFIIKQGIALTEVETTFSQICEPLFFLFIVYIIFTIMAAFMEYFKSAVLARNTQNLIFKIREESYKKVMKFNMDTFSNMHISTLVTRMTADITNIGDFIGRILPMFISSGIFLFVILIAMFFINIQFAIIMIMCSLVLVFLMLFLGKKMAYYNKKDIELTEKLNNYFGETFSGIKTIHIFNIQKERKNILDSYHKREIDVAKKYFTVQSFLTPIKSVTRYSIIAIVIYLCLQNKVAGIDIGIIYLVISYIDKFFEPLGHILYHYESLQKGVVSIKRIDELLGKSENIEKIYIGEKTEKLEGNIRFSNVNFSYSDNEFILNNVNFNINRGERIALVGETGAGKTTIVNLILGFYKINSGNILFDGKSSSDISLESIRKNISFIQQNPYIFKDTIKKNIIVNVNNTISDEKIIGILKQTGLYEKVEQFKNGIYEIINDNTFSKGEKQLLAFARAIARETSIYIFDEPTSNIDIQSEKKLKNIMDQISSKATIIVIAHRPATIENSDRIFMVENGKVLDINN